MQSGQDDLIVSRLALKPARTHRLGRVVFWMLVIADVMFGGVRMVLSVL